MSNLEIQKYVGRWSLESSDEQIPPVDLVIEADGDKHIVISTIDKGVKTLAVSSFPETFSYFNPAYQKNMKQTSRAEFFKGNFVVGNIWLADDVNESEKFLGVGLSEWSVDGEGKLTEKKSGYTYEKQGLAPWSIRKTFVRKI